MGRSGVEEKAANPHLFRQYNIELYDICELQNMRDNVIYAVVQVATLGINIADDELCEKYGPALHFPKWSMNCFFSLIHFNPFQFII